MRSMCYKQSYKNSEWDLQPFLSYRQLNEAPVRSRNVIHALVFVLVCFHAKSTVTRRDHLKF